ncbi:MAG: malate dehydrogenase [Candidatus Latescibacteria bacterium]|nr:malate dehydrogenase [Candidatus Latescibacterota bacterium]
MTDRKQQITRETVLEYHLGGKIGLDLQKNLKSDIDLSLAYTPGVAEACRLIESEPESVWNYTAKGKTVAVVTDGTAVLGLGDIGASASIPVMEGKAVLFKAFAGVDAWPVPLEGVRVNGKTGRSNIDAFVETTARLAVMYGGINIEDVAAPECFEIEDRLKEILDIPVFHDDQHGTAIISLAGLKNYLYITDKKIEDIKIVINGGGAAGIRIGELFRYAGAQYIVMCDSKGVIHDGRDDLSVQKQQFAIPTPERCLRDAMKNSDVFIGVSKPYLVDGDMIKSMAPDPAVFAMANPEPEIRPEKVYEARVDAYVATGRSDYPNQINNVLGFPFIFRGALDVRASDITTNMKIACSNALADLAREVVPDYICEAYGGVCLDFGREYLIPKPFDRRVLVHASLAVAEAAIKDGVARKPIDPGEYKAGLEQMAEKLLGK